MQIRDLCRNDYVNPPGFFLTQKLFNYPGCGLIGTILLFGLIPLSILYSFPISIDSNPEKGFDTRGTDSAGARLAWSQLQPQLLQGSRIVVEVPSSNLLLNHFKNRTKRSWADDFIATLSGVACYDDPVPAMSYLSQFILELPEYEELYSRPFLNELCHLNNQIGDKLKPFDAVTPYRNIWHVANFFACIAPTSRSNCSFLTADDIKKVRLIVETCIPHRKAIIECREGCQRPHELQIQSPNTCPEVCPEGLNIPKECNGQMLFDLFYRILPDDLMARPFYVNAFLPIYTFASYRMYGYDVSLSAYKNLEKALVQITESSNYLKIKGGFLNLLLFF